MAPIDSLRGLTSSQMMAWLFPQAKYLWLMRRDKVRQAISHELASSTNEWWAVDGAIADKPEGSIENPEFDAGAIARAERIFAEEEAQWHAYFADRGIMPLVVHYEDMVADYPGTIVSVLKWLGVPNADAVHVPPPRLKRQSNARNEEWVARYAAFKSAGGNFEFGTG